MRKFLRETRAGATALTAAVIALMTLGATGLIVDHVWLVSKRDILKSAADAAVMATTLRLRKLSRELSDEEVNAILLPIAQRYVVLNVQSNIRRDWQESDIVVTLEVDRTAGAVVVNATAPIGSTLAERFHGYDGPETITAGAGAEAGIGPVRAVLAIDTSKSMRLDLRDGDPVTEADARMEIVKEAARVFLEALPPSADQDVAVGLVPWGKSVGTTLAPSTTSSTLQTAINALVPWSGGTSSSRGLKAARAQLENTPDGARLAIVLLTDGEDNFSDSGPCRRTKPNCSALREAQCKAAKAAGIEVFTVAAMHPAQVSATLGKDLTACASSKHHAFLNNNDSETLKAAFSTIGGSLRATRRTY